jgi:acyl-CoA thioester hydrolase
MWGIFFFYLALSMAYLRQIQIRWGDLDPNFHVRHSAYYDYGAFVRVSFFNEHGMTPTLLQAHHIGPILFKESCTFRRELHFGDELTISIQVTRSKTDYSRWSMRHELVKQENILAAVIEIDGAIIHTNASLPYRQPFFSHAWRPFPKRLILPG